MLNRFRMILAVLLFAAGGAWADGLYKSTLGSASDEIIYTDVDNDGDADVLERWWNGKRCRWFDENDDMTRFDKLGDLVSDCVQVDMDGDGVYDGAVDLSVKWADNDGDGRSDMQIVVINPQVGKEKKFGGAAHYMVFDDTDRDNVMVYFDWSKFDFLCWRNTGRCDFSADYNGDSIFLKAHMAPFGLSDARLNWENPFAFYDMDDDGCTEMSVRLIDNPLCNAKLDSAYISYDLDNDSQRDNEMDYDLTLRFEKNEEFDYSKYVNKYPDIRAPKWVPKYFQRPEWRVIDELIYVPHDKCYEEAFGVDWERCYLTFDEDDDDHRWERVELYYPNDPYALRGKNSYEASRQGSSTPMNIHPQSDSLGDRGEFDKDNSGRGKLYISKWDGRIHLYGAEWGSWALDSEGKYFGAVATPQVSSPEMAKELEAVVMYYDTDQNGFFDLVEFDYDADRVADLSVSLLDYGTDEFELIDPAAEKWLGLHEIFKKNAVRSWAEACGLYRAFWRKGLSGKSIDDLAFASSTWEKYFHGAKLKEAIFRALAENLKADPENLWQLMKYYFSGDFAGMEKWLLGLDFSDSLGSAFLFNVKNPLAIERKDELVSIPLNQLRNLDTDSFVVYAKGKVWPSQLDDTDFDGIADAVVFLLDMEADESVEVTVNNTDKPTASLRRAHAEISIQTKMPEAAGTGKLVDGGAFKSKTYLFRMPDNQSSAYRYEGPLIESDKVAYRLYWDSRGAIDVFGKVREAFLGDAHTHKASHHTMQSWGRDLLHNGSALGVGGLGIGVDDKRFSPGRAKSARIIIGTDGPIKSSYRMVYEGFEYKGKSYSLTWDISMSAGQRYLSHVVTVTEGGALDMMAALTNHSDEHDAVEVHGLDNKAGLNWFGTYGDQVFDDEDKSKAAVSTEQMGLALLWDAKKAAKAEETDLEYRVLFKPAQEVRYYSLAAYNQEFGDDAIKDAGQFKAYLQNLADKLASPVLLK